MRRSAFFVIFLLAFSMQFGCGKAAVNANTETVTEVPTVSPFAEMTDANAIFAEGNRLFDDNQTELAIEAYKRAVEINPDFAEAYFKLGIAFALIEKEALRTGTGEIVPGETTVGNKTVKHNSEKMFEKAVAAYKKLIRDSPDDAVSHFNLGRAYNKLNKDEEAEKSFETAVKLKPEEIEYLTELGGARIKLAKYHEAIVPLKKALELDPESAKAEELLEDAQAGAKRVDYNQPDNTNTAKKPNSNAVANSNTNANVAGNANSATKPTNTDTKPKIETRPKKDEPKDKKLERPGGPKRP